MEQIPPVCTVGGKKTRLSTNYSRQTKEKPVLALAQEIFSPSTGSYREAAPDKPIDTV